MQRRRLLQWSAACAVAAQPLARCLAAMQIPTEVAGVAVPRTPLARAAADFSRTHCPAYLFNHSMRTYLFGALLLHEQGLAYQAEAAFVAAAFHDLGLLPQFAGDAQSFEIDGANFAERWAREQHATPEQASRIWYAIALHDGEAALIKRQGPEALLIARGAGADVDGIPAGRLEGAQIEAVLAAFPRLAFKQQFTALLVAHCRRKPQAQRGTWLESLCRDQVPGSYPAGSVEREVGEAHFAE